MDTVRARGLRQGKQVRRAVARPDEQLTHHSRHLDDIFGACSRRKHNPAICRVAHDKTNGSDWQEP